MYTPQGAEKDYRNDIGQLTRGNMETALGHYVKCAFHCGLLHETYIKMKIICIMCYSPFHATLLMGAVECAAVKVELYVLYVCWDGITGDHSHHVLLAHFT